MLTHCGKLGSKFKNHTLAELVSEASKLVEALDTSIGRPPFSNPSSDESVELATSLSEYFSYIILKENGIKALKTSQEVCTTFPVLCTAFRKGSKNESPCLKLFAFLLQCLFYVHSISLYPLKEVLSDALSLLPQSLFTFKLFAETGMLTEDVMRRILFLPYNDLQALPCTAKNQDKNRKMKTKKSKASGSLRNGEALAEGQKECIEKAAETVVSIFADAENKNPLISAELMQAIVETKMPPCCVELVVSLFSNTTLFVANSGGCAELALTVLNAYSKRLYPLLKPWALVPCLHESLFLHFIHLFQMHQESARSSLADSHFLSSVTKALDADRFDALLLSFSKYQAPTELAMGTILAGTFFCEAFTLRTATSDGNVENPSKSKNALVLHLCNTVAKAGADIAEKEYTFHSLERTEAKVKATERATNGTGSGLCAAWMRPLSAFASLVFMEAHTQLHSSSLNGTSMYLNPTQLERVAISLSNAAHEYRHFLATDCTENEKKSCAIQRQGKKSKGTPKEGTPSSSVPGKEDFFVTEFLFCFVSVACLLISIILIQGLCVQKCVVSLMQYMVDVFYRLANSSNSCARSRDVWHRFLYSIVCFLLHHRRCTKQECDLTSDVFHELSPKLHRVLIAATEKTGIAGWCSHFLLGNIKERCADSKAPLASIITSNPQLLCLLASATGAELLTVGSTPSCVAAEHSNHNMVLPFIYWPTFVSLGAVSALCTECQLKEFVELTAGKKDAERWLLALEMKVNNYDFFSNGDTLLDVSSWENGLRSLCSSLSSYLDDKKREALHKNQEKCVREQKELFEKVMLHNEMNKQEATFRAERERAEKQKEDERQRIRAEIEECGARREEKQRREKLALMERMQLAHERVREENARKKEEAARNQRIRIRKYQEKMGSMFRVATFLEHLHFPPSRIMGITRALDGVMLKITPDDLLEYIVTGNAQVPDDMATESSFAIHSTETETHKAPCTEDGQSSFWSGVMKEAELNHVGSGASHRQCDTHPVTDNLSVSPVSFSFHRRVKIILDLFDYSGGDEQGNVPDPLPSVSIVEASIVLPSQKVKELTDFNDVYSAILACQERALCILKDNKAQLTLLGYRYHFPFHDEDGSVETLLEAYQRFHNERAVEVDQDDEPDRHEPFFAEEQFY